MKKVCVVGHFGFGKQLLNGQTVKVKTVTSELENQLGENEIEKIDTHGGLKKIFFLIINLIKAFKSCNNIIIFPAHNGIKVFAPLCVIINSFYKRGIHYSVIGGWLPEFLESNKRILNCIKKFDGVYVETLAMKSALEELGLNNVIVMPNFKNVKVLNENELVYSIDKPLKLCTFSRVMREKGIAEICNAVRSVNEKNRSVIYSLDIYGQIDDNQIDWFEKLRETFPEYIKYGGLVPFDKSVDTIKKYYALVFPTYYSGEGFAGTLIDAMSAGVPIIASDWRYNSEFVIPGRNGLLVKPKSEEELINVLEKYSNCEMNKMKSFCISEAINYSPEKVIQILITRLK